MTPAAGARRALALVPRRKWTILAPAIVVPLALVLVSFWQGPRFEASAEVLVTPAPGTLPGQAEPGGATEAELARLREVVERTVQSAGLADRTADDLLEASSVTPIGASDLLRFRVSDPVEEAAVRLANVYASEYAAYREALGSTEGATALVVEHAERAEQVRPRALRNALVGIALGVALGLTLALLWQVLDIRVRRPEDIAARLGLPFLGRLPRAQPGRRRRDGGAGPTGAQAEALRALTARLERAAGAAGGQVIMFTSRDDAEEKSATVADLALLLAREGRRVALVDLDLRRPRLARHFRLDTSAGVASVLLGERALEDALAVAPLTGPRPPAFEAAEAESAGELLAELLAIRSVAARHADANGAAGLLEVLPAGAVSAEARALVHSDRLGEILGALRSRAEIVLVDGPPLTRADEVRAVSAHVDGLVLLAPPPVPGSVVPDELHRALDGLPADKLGVVVTGA